MDDDAIKAKDEENEASSSSSPPKKKSKHQGPGPSTVGIVVLAAVFGLAGGLLSTYLLGPSEQQIIENREEIVLQEGEVIAEVADEVGPSVVSINVQSTQAGVFSDTRSQSAGSGIILSEDGLVVTNKHVVSGQDANIAVVDAEGQEYTDVELVDEDPTTDIAFLQINGAEDLTPAELGESTNVRVGEKVIAIGNALGQYDNTVTSGIISGIGRPVVAGDGTSRESLTNLFQTDAAINPGNSGGPLVNLSGQVVGINTAVAGNAENIGFAIPIDDVKTGIESVKETGEIIKPYLGVRYLNVNANIAEEFDLPVEQGAYLFASQGSPIIDDSPAEEAGLEFGDIITHVDGEEVTDRNVLATLIGKHEVGEDITLTILRDGDEQEVAATLDRLPSNL